jgi:hypothetical protein
MDYEWLRRYNRADVELPSGIGVTLSLVRAQETLISGGIPRGVLKEMDDLAAKARSNGDGPEVPDSELSPEVLDRGQWFQREMVRRTIRRVAPSVAELDGPDDYDVPMWVVEKFDQADFDALKDYALRNTPLPAASPA